MNNNQLPVLEVRNITKAFSGIYALDDVCIKIFPGKVNSIIGENGAGKTTLMKIISGVYSNYKGEILLNNRIAAYTNPEEASKNGVVIIHQELNLFSELTVAENIFLGHEPVDKLGLIDFREMKKKTGELLNKLHLSVDPLTRVSQLRIGQQQVVEIAKALLLESKVLIMDEPTSALSEAEVSVLFGIIKELKEKGVAVVYISHKLDELFEIADLYTVLRDGKMIGSGIMSEISRDGLIRMMVGRDIKPSITDNRKEKDKEILRVENLSLRNPSGKPDFLVKNVSFKLNRGEVLGIYGLMGSGRTELLEAIFGLFPRHTTGKVYTDGIGRSVFSINAAITSGIALVPEDRKLQGLIMSMSVKENTSLASLFKISRFSFIDKRKEASLSSYFIEKLRIHVNSPGMEVQKLSGGNQQKVVISKWLALNPKVLLLDEPARGIDIGAKAEIYDLISKLAKQGMGIVVVSSDLSEILTISDSVMVMAESLQKAIMDRAEASEEIIMKAALMQN